MGGEVGDSFKVRYHGFNPICWAVIRLSWPEMKRLKYAGYRKVVCALGIESIYPLLATVIGLGVAVCTLDYPLNKYDYLSAHAFPEHP